MTEFVDRHKKFEEASGRKLDDFNAELSETKSGYTYRSSAALPESNPNVRAKKARRAEAEFAQLTALQALMNDPDYATVYQAAHDTITEFKSRMHTRLAQLETQIQGFDEALETLKPGSEEYTRLIQQREATQRKQQDLLDYYEGTIRPVEDRMNDPDNPLSKSDLEDFNEQVQQNAADRFFDSDLTDAPIISRPQNLPMPSIG